MALSKVNFKNIFNMVHGCYYKGYTHDIQDKSVSPLEVAIITCNVAASSLLDLKISNGSYIKEIIYTDFAFYWGVEIKIYIQHSTKTL